MTAAPTAGAVAGPALHRPYAAAGGGADGDEGARGPKKTRQEMIAERQAARNAALAKSGRGRAKMGGGEDEIDPMDPVSTECRMCTWCIGGDCLVAVAVVHVMHKQCLPAANLRMNGCC
jgi:hypothetical protein